MQISSVAFYTGNIHCHHENHSVIYYFKFYYAKESEKCITVIWVFYSDYDEKVLVPVINETHAQKNVGYYIELQGPVKMKPPIISIQRKCLVCRHLPVCVVVAVDSDYTGPPMMSLFN